MMHIYAWILGVLAICSSVALGTNWQLARHGLAASRTAEASFIQARQAAVNLIAEEKRSDEKELRRTKRDIEIVRHMLESDRLHGQNTSVDKMRLAADQQYVDAIGDYQTHNDVIGHDDYRIEGFTIACKHPRLLRLFMLGVYADMNILAYATGILWLAFGFAAALTGNTAP